MNNIILSPPLAFLIFLGLAGLLTLFGRALAGPSKPSEMKSSSYSSGEAGPTIAAAPGYQQFFRIALFFAILHLGVLMVGSGGLTKMSGVYLIGLILALVAFILG